MMVHLLSVVPILPPLLLSSTKNLHLEMRIKQQEIWNIVVLQKFPERHREGQGTSCLGEGRHQASAPPWPGLVLPFLCHGRSPRAEARLLERLRKRMSSNRSEFSVLQLPRLQAGITGLGEGTERKGLKAFGVSGKFSISAGGRRTPQCDPGSVHTETCPSCQIPAGALLGHCWGHTGTSDGQSLHLVETAAHRSQGRTCQSHLPPPGPPATLSWWL